MSLLKVEYALTGTTLCKDCGETIEKLSLRFVTRSFDDITGMYHFECFFYERKPQSIGSIECFNWLKKKDQERIKRKFDEAENAQWPMTRLRKRKIESEKQAKKTLFHHFKVEYAKSSLSICASCNMQIPKKSIRVSKKSISKFLDENDIDPNDKFHLDCFAENREELSFFGNENNLPGFDEMHCDDQIKIKDAFSSLSDVDDDPNLKSNEADLLKIQDKLMSKHRDFLKELSHSVLDKLLLFNSQETTGGKERKLDLLSDIMTFGALELCEACGGQFVFQNGIGYKCTGNVSNWSKCNIVVKKPARKLFKIPTDISKEYLFLADFKSRVDDRLFKTAVIQKPIVINDSDSDSDFEYSEMRRSGKNKQAPKRRRQSFPLVNPGKNIYKDANGIYSAVLSLTDIQTGRNSFYKIQLLVDEATKEFSVWRSWGKIGTDGCKGKTETMPDLQSAKKQFCQIFLKKTGNEWINRSNFEKKPNLMFPMDVDNEEIILPEDSPVLSKLSQPVRDLVSMIFDRNVMIEAMITNKLDMAKLPLGALSRTQILKAFMILAELQQEKRFSNDRWAIDASNRFYTLIPHSFPGRPQILNSEKLIDSKLDMLEELLEIENTYGLMKQAKENQGDLNFLDVHYKVLNCNIKVVDKNSEEFKIIETYAYKTNSQVHGYSQLKIIEAFKVKRGGEHEKYDRKYKNLHNKKLLWHGSRITNFAGILCQGLKIAPPEAPSTGTMFGRGIYFADMISKSANYCHASSEGLILLCEVALGEIYERTNAEFITQLPHGKNSTRGLGMVYPDPEGSIFIDGVEIPCGNIIASNRGSRTLMHNEYIIYDVDQVKIKYVLKLKFR